MLAQNIPPVKKLAMELINLIIAEDYWSSGDTMETLVCRSSVFSPSTVGKIFGFVPVNRFLIDRCFLG